MHMEFPATVMVLGLVSNERNIIPSHFFEEERRINAASYIKVLEEVVKECMRR